MLRAGPTSAHAIAVQGWGSVQQQARSARLPTAERLAVHFKQQHCVAVGQLLPAQQHAASGPNLGPAVQLQKLLLCLAWALLWVCPILGDAASD